MPRPRLQFLLAKGILDTAANALATGFWLWLAWRQGQAAWQSVSPLTWLLCAESLLVAVALLRRRPAASAGAPPHVQALILVSALCGPLLVDARLPAGGTGRVLAPLVSTLGVLLIIWSLCTLGRAFGITPADRGLVSRGPYRLLRHPMYSGALLNLLAVVLANPQPANLLVWCAVLASCLYRIRLEERTLSGYDDYARQVRWRLLPGIY